jgi:carboxymethylenebutenolidase
LDRKTARDFPPEVLKLFDGFVHGSLTRREFFDRAAKYAVGGMSAAAFFEALNPNFAWAQQVKKDDSRIKADYVDYDAPQGSGKMRGYLGRPAKAGKVPGVIVVHENRGLNPYVEDVAAPPGRRRLRRLRRGRAHPIGWISGR